MPQTLNPLITIMQQKHIHTKMHTGKNKQSFFQVWKYNSTIRKLHIL